MADDLATLQQYGSFQDEEEMRQEVAARVVANSSRAALEDEERLAQAWRSLEKAEHAVSELEMELGDAQYAAAQEAIVLPGAMGNPSTTSSSSAKAEALRRISDIKFQLNAAQVELKRVDATVRQTQKEVDQRQAARLAEARRKEREQAAAELRTAPSASAAAAAASASNPGSKNNNSISTNASNGAGSANTRKLIPLSVRAANGKPSDTNAPARPTASTATGNGTHNNSNKNNNMGNTAATPAASPTTRTATRVVYRVPTHLRGVTQSDYSGGEVLPSLSRVQVTRADIRSKQRRYQDDADVAHYLERITKRQRLEAMANQQRRLAATAGGTSAPSSVSAAMSLVEPSSPALAAVEGAKMKREQDSTHQENATQRRGSGPAQVKAEPGTEDSGGRHGETCTTRGTTPAAAKKEETEGDSARHPVKVEKAENSTSLLHNFSNTRSVKEEAADAVEEKSVIDVDALMEDDDDAAVEAAMHRVSTQLHHAQSDGAPSNPLAAADGSKREAGTQELGEDDLVLEMDEVTLMPGVRMDATIYNRLLDYQQEGLLWLLSLHSRRAGGILGDEMGLGKTIQVAALLNALHHSGMLRGPVLIVSPMTVLRQWLAELHRWAPYMRSCVMHESSGSEGTREALLRSVQGTPAIIITTFAAMRVHCALLQRTGFQYVILDEGHKISNPEAGVTLAAKSFTTPHRLILSGSPIQNSLKELWCLFDFVRPGLLGTMNRFIDEFETPIAQSRNVRASPLALATAVECAKTLQAHIAPYLLRRLKRQVNTQLPPKYERVLRVPLTDQQLEQYLQVLSSPVVQRLFAQTVMYGGSNGGLNRDGRDSTGSLHIAGARLNMATKRNNSGVRLESFRLMNQLRQICNHADIYAVQKGADEEDRMLLSRKGAAAAAGRGPLRPGQHRSFRSNNPVNLLGSGKLNALLMMLKEWKSFGHRVLVFSQTRMMLDIIENMCEQQNYTYIRMDGATNGHHRQELMDRFNEDENIFVALLTTRVGGIGVNLIGADRVVIFDPDWNPITDVQARERAWRIGQRREVCVYRLITSGSVEEAILRRQLAKMYVTDKVLNDPELQRFFHVQDSFMENFLLGSEYEPRVPMDKKYLLTAHQLHNSTAATPTATTATTAASRRPPVVDETLGDYGGAVPGADDGATTSSSDSEDDEQERDDSFGDAEVMAKDEDVDDEDADGVHAVSSPRPPKKAKKERDFGLLVPIKDEGDIEDEGNGGAKATLLDSTSASALGRGNHLSPQQQQQPDTNQKKGKKNGAAWSETQLLQDLVNKQDVVIAGNDRIAQRLARQKAEDMLQRVSSRASVMEVMREQQKQFSLLHALEEKKAKEAAEREEKRQYYRAEMAAVAAKRRRE